MALRGKPPTKGKKRLKFLMYSKAGVGKTIAALKMPSPYIIDTEQGTVHYGNEIKKSGGRVFHTNDMDEATVEIKELMTGKHEFRTLVIDPFTPLYETKLDEGERDPNVGTEFGRHYGYAAKFCKRMFNLLTMIDMNVVVTCHSKNEYGDAMKIIGVTFDGWKKLDYIFDLVLELQRVGTKRIATVRKTRLQEFPDMEQFEWSYEALVEHYGSENLERAVESVKLATPKQVQLLNTLVETLNVSDEIVQKWQTKAKVETLDDMTTETIGKCIDHLKKQLEAASSEAA